MILNMNSIIHERAVFHCEIIYINIYSKSSGNGYCWFLFFVDSSLTFTAPVPNHLLLLSLPLLPGHPPLLNHPLLLSLHLLFNLPPSSFTAQSFSSVQSSSTP
jgi:hypothetical protein